MNATRCRTEHEEFLAALGRLAEPEQTVLRLVFQARDVGQVADRLTVPVVTIRGIASRALLALRAELAARPHCPRPARDELKKGIT